MSKKRTPYETMKSFSWIYIIMAAIYGIGTIICFAMPELRDGLEESLGGNDGMIKFGITAGITILLNLWYFWLARRVAAKKSDGVLYGALLILGIVGIILSTVWRHEESVKKQCTVGLVLSIIALMSNIISAS